MKAEFVIFDMFNYILSSPNYFENQLVTTVGDGKASRRLIQFSPPHRTFAWLLWTRGDHFEIKFIENCCKFENFLVKIGTYGLPKPFVGLTSPQVPAVLPIQPTYWHGYKQATWAEVVEPGGMTDPFMVLAIHMYLFLLRNF